MNNINYKLLTLTEETIKTLEYLRFDAYEMDPTKFPPEQTFYSKELREGKYIAFGCYLNNQLIGACYISKSHNSLYIEQLFIKKEYQNNKLHLGTKLLLYVLENKQIIEEYFQTKFYYSYLDNYQNTINFYRSIGYQETNNLMRKRL